MAKIFVNRRHLVSIALVCALVIFAAVPARAAGPVVLRAGASDPEGTTAPALSIGKLCELATKLSNGELNVQPFYQSLGIEQQLATAVKAGSVDIGFTATSNLAPFTDALPPVRPPLPLQERQGLYRHSGEPSGREESAGPVRKGPGGQGAGDHEPHLRRRGQRHQPGDAEQAGESPCRHQGAEAAHRQHPRRNVFDEGLRRQPHSGALRPGLLRAPAGRGRRQRRDPSASLRVV